MSLKEAAFRQAVLAAVHKAIGDELKAARPVTQEGLETAYEALGAKQITVSLPDGTPVATVSLTDPKPRAEVADEQAFVKWVGEAYPSETVTTVRPAFAEQLLGAMTKAGAAVDPATGELVTGVEMREPSSRSHSLRFKPGGREAIAEAWRSGALPTALLPELTAGGAS